MTETGYIVSVFNEVLAKFPALEYSSVHLVHGALKGATMNARPVISDLFKPQNRRYQVIVAKHVRDSGSMRVADLPKEVLKGWFAHELGHIMDYRNQSSLQMVLFGLKYLASDSFRRQAEHVADQYAIRYGFHSEIISAKEFILENELLTPAYKDKISKYYMSIDQVRWHTENPHSLENLFMG